MAIPPAVVLSAGLASGSRAGAVLLVAECVAGLYLLRRRAARGGGGGWNETRRLWRKPVLVFASASAVFASVAGAGVLIRRLEEPDPLQVRREIYRSAEAMIESGLRQSRWLGYGLGTFAEVYPEYAEFDNGAVVAHAHSDWLEWTAEGGPLYVATWGALLVWAAGPAIGSMWGIGVIAVFAHAMVDFPFARLGISAWVFLLVGVLARESERSPPLGLLIDGGQR